MAIRNSKTHGFTLVEVSLAVVTVFVLAGLSFAVYQHNKTQATSAAPNTNQGNNQQGTSTTAYFNIKEWNIRTPYSGSLNLTYTLSSNSKIATFSSDKLSAASSECVGYGGSIMRWASNDQVSEGPPETNTPTATQYFANSPIPYMHIGNYYYTFAHAQSACGDPSVTSALETQTNDAVKALIPSLQTATTN
jgi:hypothetical protein